MEGRGRKLVSLVMDRQEPPSFGTITDLNNVNIISVADQSEDAYLEEQALPLIKSIYANLPSLGNSPCHNEVMSSAFNNVAEYNTNAHQSAELFELQPVCDLIKSTSTLFSTISDSEDSTASKSILSKGNISTLEQDNYIVPFVSSYGIDLTANNSLNSQSEISELVTPKPIGNSANADNKYLKSDGEDFSPDDSGDEYRPAKRTRKMSSSSSSSSTSSSSNSSSCSSSNNSTTRNSNLIQSGETPEVILHQNSHCSNSVTPNDETSLNAQSIVQSPNTNKKKRMRNEDEWKKNKTKQLKNSGKQYVSRTGKTVPAKAMKPSCTDKCRYLCSNKFSEDQRREIFNMYWDLSTFQRQRDFLNSVIIVLQPAVRRVRTSTRNRKPNTYYSLVNNGQNVRVCKTFLLNTLGIAERTLRTVIEAKTSENFLGGAPIDSRGKHDNHTKNDPEVIDSIRVHINSIPRIESHYLRANTTREYIDGGLTVADLHREYKKMRESVNKTAANYDLYYRIFTQEFNISFFIPKKDQCDLCESRKNAVGVDEVLENKYLEHLRQKELSRAEKKKDIETCRMAESNSIVAIFDLQAVMPVPIGESSAFFYKSKLNCLNLTITDIKNKETNCYFWHEALGGRGAVEVGSCVYKFLQKVSEKYPNSNVTFYTDNCCGQQKNRFIFAMYLYAVKTLRIKTITHKFLIRGHTQNEGDTAHSLIERAIKKSKKSGPIYVPEQYIQIIRSAKKNGNPFIVEELNYDNFYDLKKLSEEIGLNTAKDLQGNTIKINDIKMIQFQKETETYRFKTGYEEDWIEAATKISRRTKGDARDINDLTLKQAYSGKIAIAQNKKSDLQELIQKNIIPSFYCSFYDSILNI